MQIYKVGGDLEFSITEGKLIRDIELFGKQDPYCKITFKGKEEQTEVASNAGKTPKWTKTFRITVKDLNDDLLIEVFDKGMASDDLIGFCNIKVSSLIINAEPGRPKPSDWFSVFYNNERAGFIKI